MSPEQIRAAANVDARTDVWSLGVTLFEMLSHRLPFEGEVASQVIVGIVNEPPQSLAALRPDLPAELVAVVHQCLEKNPDLRPRSVGELAALLVPFGSPDGAVHAERAMRTSGGLSSSGPHGDRISQRGTTPSRPMSRSMMETLPATSNTPLPARPVRKAMWVALVAAPVAVVAAIAAFALGRGAAPAHVASSPPPSVTATAEPRASAQPLTPVETAAVASVAVPSATASSQAVPATSARIRVPVTALPTKPTGKTAIDGTEDRY